MSIFTIRAYFALGLGLAVISPMMTGCAAQKREQATPAPSASAIGADMQKNGIMSQQDYVKIRALQHAVTQTHTMSDADLDWTLALLANSNNSIPRARALTALSEIHPMSAAQRAKIAPAIAPFLNSTDKLDQLGAQRVQKAMDKA